MLVLFVNKYFQLNSKEFSTNIANLNINSNETGKN